jgi:hypothetical protein
MGWGRRREFPGRRNVNWIEQPRAPRLRNAPAQHKENLVMKSMIVAAAATLAIFGLLSGPANAREGCVKGAVIGGVVGHVVGGHGLLGAGAGCMIGRHEADRHDRRSWDRDRNHEGYGSSYEPQSRYREGYGYSR